MVDEPDNLVLEHVPHLRRDMSDGLVRVETVLRDVAAQQRMTNAHVAGLVRHDAWAADEFAEIEVRTDHIESRPSLRDNGE
jgi:hypothetical protein